MVKVIVHGESRYIDGYLKRDLDFVKGHVKKNWDFVTCVFGMEGVGKTWFACQVAAYLDPTFSLERVCWDANTFAKLIHELPPYSAIVLDEAHDVFSSATENRKLQSRLISILTTCRSKRLFLFLVSPSIFDMKPYVAVHRSMCWYRVVAPDYKRGVWYVYNRRRKKNLYWQGKRIRNEDILKPNKKGRFTNWVPFDPDEYEKRKIEALKRLYGRKARPDEDDLKELLKKLLPFLDAHEAIAHGGQTRIARALKVNKSTISKWITGEKNRQQGPGAGGA